MSRKLAVALFIGLWGGIGLIEWITRGLPIYYGSSVSIGQNLANLACLGMLIYGICNTILLVRQHKAEVTARLAEEKAKAQTAKPRTEFASLRPLLPDLGREKDSD